MTARNLGQMPNGPGRFAVVALSMLSLLALWQISAQVADPRTLPGPATVWQVARAEISSGEIARHLGATLRRVALAFAIVMTQGSIIGWPWACCPA
jgi:NitT/TauT family transport system permease protein